MIFTVVNDEKQTVFAFVNPILPFNQAMYDDYSKGRSYYYRSHETVRTGPKPVNNDSTFYFQAFLNGTITMPKNVT